MISANAIHKLRVMSQSRDYRMSFCHLAGVPQRETATCANAVILETAWHRLQRRMMDTRFNQKQVAQTFTNQSNPT